MNIQQLESQMIERFTQKGLLSQVDRDHTQILDLGGELWVEVVLYDATRSAEVENLMRSLLESSESLRSFALTVRSRWKISDIEDPIPAYAPDGGLRAAVLVPVRLSSGAKQVTITVAITKLAEWEFERILGGKAPLKRIAEVVVESSLLRGGQSAWDPIAQDYLEVASGGVANITRLLQQAA